MYYSGNYFLTQAEMEVNATYIYNYLYPRGWTINSISALLGNMETESTLNPAIWQDLIYGNMSGGYGLVQWTPATNFIDWCTENGKDHTQMESNLARIEWEVEHREQWYATSTYNFSFEEFKVSTLSPNYLAKAFLANYERPKAPEPEVRGAQADAWYLFLTGVTPPTDPTDPTNPSEPKKYRKLPIWMMLRPY